MPVKPKLFSNSFLHPYLESFPLSSVVSVYQIRETIKRWNDGLGSGKLESEKEESIKSRFLIAFFGDILGFNYNNTSNWLYQEELKTNVDGTKPDASLGLFFITENGLESDVRIVIEVKDAGKDLDKPQNRTALKITPVDQAMLYATKIGAGCRWVVVTNLKEIRFYQASDQTRYQSYKLAELLEDKPLKELLFLFHRDRFYKGTLSATDRLLQIQSTKKLVTTDHRHVIDQLYYSLKKYNSLPFVDPRHIANIKPFNILDEHVWHYAQGHLFTINPEIYTLLIAITFVDQEMVIADEYAANLIRTGVLEYKEKLEYIFKKLHASHVFFISAIRDIDAIKVKNKNTIGFSLRYILDTRGGDGIFLKIDLPVNEACECLSCRVHSLDFRKIAEWLNAVEGQPEMNTLEVAYAHYKLATDNFKKAYHIYKTIEQEAKGDEHRLLEYFVAKYNLKQLHNLILDDDENKTIKADVSSIDLNRVINDELDLYIDQYTRKLLLGIKEDKVFHDAEKKVRELLGSLKYAKAFFKKGGMMSAPDYIGQLFTAYGLAHGHVQSNYIIKDAFTDYRTLVAEFFRCLLVSHRTREKGFKKFRDFELTEAILYIEPKVLGDLLTGSPDLPLTDHAKRIVLKKSEAFLRSYCHESVFGRYWPDKLLEKQLLNYQFQQTFTDVFNNVCTLLAHIDLETDEFKPVAEALVKFIEIEEVLSRIEINFLGELIKIKASLFTEQQLGSLLDFTLNNHCINKSSKYENLLVDVPKALHSAYPDFRFSNKTIAKRAVINCYADHGRSDLKPLVYLWRIADDVNKQYLDQEFETNLDESFDYTLCELLFKKKVWSVDRKDYLEKLTDYVNRRKGPGFVGFKNDNPDWKDTFAYNLLIIPYVLDLDFNMPAFAKLTNLSPFETWLANPHEFNYDDFEPRWLLAANSPLIAKRLSGFEPIRQRLSAYLKDNYDKQLSKTYFQYFA